MARCARPGYTDQAYDAGCRLAAAGEVRIMRRDRAIPKPPGYFDDGSQREQDRVSLDVFLAARDRAKHYDEWGLGPPFFSGRVDEINAFRALLARSAAGERSDATFVIEGPPGAGKTALVSQLVAEVEGFGVPPQGGAGWLPVLLSASDTASPRRIERRVNAAIGAYLAAPHRSAERRQAVAAVEEEADLQQVFDEERGVLQEALELVKDGGRNLVSAVQAHADTDPTLTETTDRIKRFLRKVAGRPGAAAARSVLQRGVGVMGVSLGPQPGVADETLIDVVAEMESAWRPYRLVLFVDEGQNIPATRPRADNEVPDALAAIHQGRTAAPISLCVAGLVGTAAALKRVGVSRIDAGRKWHLGGLSEDDCGKAVRRCLTQFKVHNGNGWIAPIAERAAGWPQHLAGYLLAAMEEISRHPLPGGDGFDAAQADFHAALRGGDAIREDFYSDRVESLASLYAEWAEHLVGADGCFGPYGANRGANRNALGTCLRKLEPDLSRADLQAFLDASVESGLLEYDAHRRTFVMPIPSFAAHLRNEPPAPFPKPRRNDGGGGAGGGPAPG